MSEEQKINVLKELRGKTKAAILLGFFPIETAQRIFGYLDDYEREVVVKELMNLNKYENHVVEFVINEYLGFLRGNNIGTINSGAEHVSKLLQGVVPEQQLEEMVGRIYSNNTRPFDSLKRIRDVGPLLTFLYEEDPQTIAVVASHMKPSQAAELLESLPVEKQAEVTVGIAKMDQTNKDILLKIEKHLNKKLETFITEEESQTDGIKILVNILNNVNRSTERTLFENLDQIDGSLSKEIKDKMFVFEDIVKLDAESLVVLVNEISDNNLIARSLRSANEELKERFYQSMSSGRKKMVIDADEGLGRLKMSDVEKAQQEVANTVKELEKSGKILIQRGDDDVIL